jgi:putative DNA primase/helicase
MVKQTKQKKVKNPDYKKFDSFISKYVDKSSAEQLQAVADGSKKYNIAKTEAKHLLNEKIKVVRIENKAKNKSIQLQQELKEKILSKETKEKERAKKNEAIEYEKKIKLQAKEMKSEQKRINEESARKEKTMIIEELESTWENCDDDLFVVACEIDWKKAKHYFVKRFMKENTHKIDDKNICGIKTFQDNKDIILYSKEHGIYAQDADIYLSSEIEKRFGEQSTNMQVKEIIESIRRRTYYDREEIQKNPKHLRPVGNGLWDIKKKELVAFTPEHVFLSKIETNHVEGADCPKFKEFLGQVLETNKEVLVAQEWLGYCLLNDVRFSKALLLYGDGENGKSVLLNAIKHFLGEKNVTSISLQYLESNPFAPARLFGKSANIFADLPKKALSQTSVFKMAVAGDALSGEKKGKDSFEFIPTLKLMFSCNEPPRTPDRTRGFFRRWIILDFKQHFPEGDPRRDENLFEKLKASDEMEGILLFALEGLYRLIEQKGFTEHMTRAEIEDFWLRHSDSVAAFILDMIEKDSLQDAPKAMIFDTYNKYCEIKGYPAEEPNHFWRRFKEIVDCSEFQPKNEFGHQIRHIKGVRLGQLNNITKDIDGYHL